MPDPVDDLVVIDYLQDADSAGWSIVALLRVASGLDARRWGTLDALCGTAVGADAEEARDAAAGGVRDAVRRLWHLVDWHAGEAEARAAFSESRSRLW